MTARRHLALGGSHEVRWPRRGRGRGEQLLVLVLPAAALVRAVLELVGALLLDLMVGLQKLEDAREQRELGTGCGGRGR